jgi:UDP-glucuronate 4-epimerase
LITCALADEPFEVFGDGSQTRDFTFVVDAVSATIAAARHGVAGSTYNIGGGSRRSLNSVCETLGELLGRQVPLKRSPPQHGDARDTAADIRRAQRDLGFRPFVDFELGLRAQLRWQRATLAVPEPVP